MLKKIFITLFLVLLFIPSSLSASNNYDTLVNNWFNTFSNKIEKKYNIEGEILYFEWFTSKLNKLLVKKKLNKAQISIVNNLIELSNEYIFNKNIFKNEFKSKQYFKNNIITKWFKNISYNSDNIFLDKWVWYSYNYDSHLKFPEWTNITNEDLIYNWINKNNNLVFLREDNTLWFVLNYKKIRLISEDLIYWVTKKYNFLKEIKNDKKKLNAQTDIYFKELKDISLKLTKWKSDNEKIKILYKYVLDNLKYTQPIVLSDYRIFSWIDTFKNNDGVCEWYVKMFLYMLNYAWISDVEAIRWYVIDAKDFPQIWHAWVRIWDKYYDPTFDDPIWAISTKKYYQYKYFALPYDLFYANRYDYNKIPTFLKEKSLSYRKNLVLKKTAPMVSKYKNSWYNLLKPFVLKLKYLIDINSKLNIENLKTIVEYYKVTNFQFLKDNKVKKITKLKYYIINNSNIEDLYEQLNYSFDWYYLFKWDLDNWNFEYRLAYDLNIK